MYDWAAAVSSSLARRLGDEEEEEVEAEKGRRGEREEVEEEEEEEDGGWGGGTTRVGISASHPPSSTQACILSSKGQAKEHERGRTGKKTEVGNCCSLKLKAQTGEERNTSRDSLHSSSIRLRSSAYLRKTRSLSASPWSSLDLIESSGSRNYSHELLGFRSPVGCRT